MRGKKGGPTLIVHPAADLQYASFVLEGLTRVIGRNSISYSTNGFHPALVRGRVLAFYYADDPDVRCLLSFADSSAVSKTGLEWARIYGMVNPRHEDVARYDKLLPIGPTFAVRLGSTRLTARHLANGCRANGWRQVPAALMRLPLALRDRRRRTTVEKYVPGDGEVDYVFYAAWPWAKHPEVNPPRARFIEACRRAPGLTFEGGFAPRRRRDVPEAVPLSAPRRYDISEYLDKLRRSAVAFNNPAVHGCHGWKLGEFLALGKATITLPLTRALPAPLEHGVHLHVVEGSPESLDAALDRLRRDHVYRRTLEVNARRWYEDHLAPSRLASRLLQLLR
jgi:hypothetical protein